MNNSSHGSSSFHSAIWAAKLLVFSLGIISTLLLLKVVVIPYLFTFFFCFISNLPTLWTWSRSWLCPPYIYIIANLIIVSIAASSTFFHHRCHFQHQEEVYDGDNHDIYHHLPSGTCDTTEITFNTWVDFTIVEDGESIKSTVADFSTPDISSSSKESKNAEQIEEEEKEKDTLDGMWKAIMEGKGKPAERQLKKSETWKEEAVVDRREMRKSETYRERSSRDMLVRREIVMCSEELNKRVEEFIKKTNKEMRLQRLESDQRFIDMVNRGL